MSCREPIYFGRRPYLVEEERAPDVCEFCHDLRCGPPQARVEHGDKKLWLGDRCLWRWARGELEQG